MLRPIASSPDSCFRSEIKRQRAEAAQAIASPSTNGPAAGFAYDRGVVAMANAGPGTTGSQFFIMMGPSSLPANYTVIGRLVSGDDVLDSIAAIPVTARPGGETSLPLETLYIESIEVQGNN